MQPSTAPASEIVGAFFSWDPVVLDRAALENAWALEDRYCVSRWDALIVAAAQIPGCAVLLTDRVAQPSDPSQRRRQ